MKIALLSAVFLFQAWLSPPLNEPINDYSGQYLLVVRKSQSCMDRHGDAVDMKPCWIYETSAFPTLIEAENNLKRECGEDYPCIRKDEFVGIYQMKIAVGRSDVKFAQGDRDIPKHVDHSTKHWEKWEITKP